MRHLQHRCPLIIHVQPNVKPALNQYSTRPHLLTRALIAHVAKWFQALQLAPKQHRLLRNVVLANVQAFWRSTSPKPRRHYPTKLSSLIQQPSRNLKVLPFQSTGIAPTPVAPQNILAHQLVHDSFCPFAQCNVAAGLLIQSRQQNHEPLTATKLVLEKCHRTLTSKIW